MFTCRHCQTKVKTNQPIGTRHRNHCPVCLFSRHVDIRPGDRKAACRGEMEPIGLTFKKEGRDKWGRKRQGELMLIHHCQKCGKLSINRVAGDDRSAAILGLLEKPLSSALKKRLKSAAILPLSQKDRPAVKRQLFGHLGHTGSVKL